jgi:hypothetical protein
MGQMFQLLTLDQIQIQKVQGFVYAKTGAGKTLFSASSQIARTFFFDIDKGLATAKTFQGDTVFPRPRKDLIHVCTVNSKDDFMEGLNYLIKNQQYFQLAVVDTATELQKYVVWEIARKAGHVIPAIQDWGQSLGIMEELARIMRDKLPHTSVLWNAHEIVREDPTSRQLMFGPAFQGAFNRDFARHFDWIGHLFLMNQQLRGLDGQVQSQVYRYLNNHADQFTEGKDRFNALQKYEVPVIDQIFGKIFIALRGEPVNNHA